MKKEVPQHGMVLLGPKPPQFETLKTRVYKKKSGYFSNIAVVRIFLFAKSVQKSQIQRGPESALIKIPPFRPHCFFIGFLVDLKTPKRPFEINRPLVKFI